MTYVLENFYKKTVTVKWATTGAGNFYVSTKPVPTSGILTINPKNTTKREIVRYNGVGTDATGDYITIVNASDRGLGGTTAQTHEVDEPVRMNITAQHWDDLNATIAAIVAAGSPDATISTKGISMLSVAPANPTSPIAVGDNDPRMLSTAEKARVPSADTAAALAGSVGTPSSTNKFLTQDNTSTATTDQSQATQNSFIETGEADATSKKNIVAQSFIPARSKIHGLKLYKTADTGAFAGTVTISIQADSSGSPSGTPLATLTLTNAQWNAFSVGEITVSFAAEYTLTVGTTYWIVIATSTSDNSNHPNFGTNSAGGYGSGSVKYKNTTDGWVAVATIDLYFKTLEGTVGQVVVTNSSGKIPSDFIDTNSLPVRAFQQNILLSAVEDLGTAEPLFGSNQDGSVFYVYLNGGGKLYRFARDTNTGMYMETHSVTPTSLTGSGDSGTIIQIGLYIYAFGNDGTNIKCFRYLAADLTGEQAMTVPVVPCTTSCTAWTDGTYAYVVSNSSNTTSRKWSVSGTTFSAVSTASVSSIANSNTSSMFDGSTAYTFSQDGGNPSSIYKLTAIDGSTKSQTTKNMPVMLADERSGGFIANIDTNRCYIGYAYRWMNELNADTQIGTMIVLYPVTKP